MQRVTLAAIRENLQASCVREYLDSKRLASRPAADLRASAY